MLRVFKGILFTQFTEMAPLKAGWLSYVITYLACLVSTVRMGGKERKNKAPQRTTKNNSCSIFMDFFEAVSYNFFTVKNPTRSSATDAKK